MPTVKYFLGMVQIFFCRSQLDEVKRRELDRLKKLARRQNDRKNGIDRKHIKIPHHLDASVDRFDVDDLKKLIVATSDDLNERDRERREEFKRYEMEKKFEKDMRLEAISDTQERKVVQEEMERMEFKHRQHEKVKMPMTKAQLEEVWENQDHMDKRDFNPKTFFMMHDLDGNEHLDENELRILFQGELQKVYDPAAPEDDMREREEEMERMREYVMKDSASKSSIRRFVITEKAPTRAFSWLKAATTAFTYKTLLRHYAKRALTPRSLNVKLGPRRNYHKGRVAIRHYANQTARNL